MTRLTRFRSHNKADCPNPRVLTGACRRCNEEGHWSKDCPNAPPMQCRECESTEHLVKDCPNRVCKNCGETGMKTAPCMNQHEPARLTILFPGHTVSQCEGARKVDRDHLPDMSTEEAWELIKRAVKERDIDDVKEAIQTYVKSSPETTYSELERAFRDQDVPVWLIAIEKVLAVTLTNMDLQGHLGKKHTVTYRFQWNPPRPRDRELWPKGVDENIERLKDAGEVVYGGLPRCNNCDEVGHISKSCPQDKIEKANAITITCFNCGEDGHRVRDCKQSGVMISSREPANGYQVPPRALTGLRARTAGLSSLLGYVLVDDADNSIASRVTKSPIAPSRARPLMSSAASVAKVSFPFSRPWRLSCSC